MNGPDRWRAEVERRARRRREAERARNRWIEQTAYLGMLGLLFILPVIAGLYLGVWLDERSQNYSLTWTLTLLALGLLIGVLNVYLFMRARR